MTPDDSRNALNKRYQYSFVCKDPISNSTIFRTQVLEEAFCESEAREHAEGIMDVHMNDLSMHPLEEKLEEGYVSDSGEFVATRIVFHEPFPHLIP